MRVLFSITYYDPYVSGLTIYVKRMSEELVKRGHKISVICFQHKDNLLANETIAGVLVNRVKPFLAVSKGFLSPLWITKSYRLVKDADCVVVNLPQFEGWITTLLAKLYNKRVLCVYHCEIELPPGLKNKIVQYAINSANKLSLLLCDSVITYTRDYADHAPLLHPFLDKVHAFYPPVLPPIVEKVARKNLQERIGMGDVTIGIAARLAKEKGIEYLIGAIPKLHSEFTLKIVIAGPIEPVGEEKYRRYIMDLQKKYTKDIVFLGTLKDSEMGAFYSLLDVLVLPSINSTEGFGMVQVEAMLCGTPVVASGLPGVRIPIHATGMGIVVPVADTSAIAQAILTIVKNKKKYIKSYAIVEKEFRLTKTVDAFERQLGV